VLSKFQGVRRCEGFKDEPLLDVKVAGKGTIADLAEWINAGQLELTFAEVDDEDFVALFLVQFGVTQVDEL